MARKRMIDPNIWQSEDFSKLSYFARLVFIGLFSNADDYGFGRAKAGYLKSVIFPYDETLKISVVDKALNEIAMHTTITFYEFQGSEYYALENWDKWQRVDKPSESQIPPLSEECKIIRRTFGERSAKPRRAVPPSIKEENIREEKRKEDKGSLSDFERALDEFKDFRKKSKKPMTEHAEELLLSELKKLAGDDEQLKIAILNQSILRGWTGVFPLKTDKKEEKPDGKRSIADIYGIDC